MNQETTLALLLAYGTCGVAAAFGIRQFLQIRRIDAEHIDEEKAALRQSARRRLWVSLFLAMSGFMMAMTVHSGVSQVVDGIATRRDAGDDSPLSDDELRGRATYATMWIIVLLLLGAAVLLIGYDMIRMRQTWRRSWQRLRDDRRAMLERQLARLRAEKTERNGYHHPD